MSSVLSGLYTTSSTASSPGIFATSRLHTPTLGYIPAGVVLMTICAAGNGFFIGELAFGGVRRPADGEHLGRALVAGDGAGGVVGAAGAEDEDGPARKIDAVGVAQVGKAHIIGVIAVEQAVFVHHRVHRPDGLGPRVDVGAVFHHQLL